MERELSARPITARPPSAITIPRTAGLTSAASRPLTRQGLAGLKPTTAAGSHRTYKDKRYYVSMIQARNAAIREELVRLKRCTDENTLKTLNLEEMRKKAAEAAKAVEHEQTQLAAHNMALEMHMSQAKEEEIRAENETMKRANESDLRKLDEVLTKKTMLEEELERMQRENSEYDQAVKEMIDALPEDQREQYFSIQREQEEVNKKIEQMQASIDKEREEVNKYKTTIEESPELEKLYKLYHEIEKLEAEKAELAAIELKNETPEQQKEALLKQIKTDKADIEALEKLAESLEEETAQLEERSAELDKELSSKDNARLKKHKELRDREAHMDSFLASYEDKLTAAREKLKLSVSLVESYLEQMVENMAELNLEEFGKGVDFSDETLEGFNKQISVIVEQKETLSRYKAKFEGEIEKLKAKKTQMLLEIEKWSDVDKCKEEMERERANLEEENQALQSKLESTQAALEESNRKKSELMRKLEDNPRYHEVVKLQKELEQLESKKAELETTLESYNKDTALEDVINEVRLLVKERNQQIINKLKAK